jgi:hypothetical protein
LISNGAGLYFNTLGSARNLTAATVAAAASFGFAIVAVSIYLLVLPVVANQEP